MARWLFSFIAREFSGLEKVSKAGAAGGPVPESLPTSLAGSDLAAAVVAVVDRSVTPSIIARGGSVRVVAVEGGVVTLEASGSPGAVLPAASHIEALLRAQVPGVIEVRVVWPGLTPT